MNHEIRKTKKKQLHMLNKNPHTIKIITCSILLKIRRKNYHIQYYHGFLNWTKLVGPTGSIENRPLMQSGYGKKWNWIKNW